MHCTYCGEELPENAKYCPNCGRKCAPGHCSRRRYILWGAVVLAAALCFAAVLVFALPLFGAENSSPVSPTPLPAPADKGFLSLSTEPAGASVKVGGEYKGVTPLTVELIPGTSYMVSVELNGKVWAESVSVKAGEKRSVGLKLNADAAEETPVPTLSPADAEKNLASRIAAAIEPANAGVRSYALGAIAASSAGAYNVRQVCDIYDALYADWVYVNDPAGTEYIAKAGESVSLLKGDCDDYAVLMASLIESIGGSARVVAAYDENSGHAYAEVYLSSSPDEVQAIINELGSRYGLTSAYYHTDSGGGYWLNLDWTASYPGGPFYKDAGVILLVRSDGSWTKSVTSYE